MRLVADAGSVWSAAPYEVRHGAGVHRSGDTVDGLDQELVVLRRPRTRQVRRCGSAARTACDRPRRDHRDLLHGVGARHRRDDRSRPIS